MLSLKEALTIAATYADPKPPEGLAYHVVVIRDGKLRTVSETAGCEIPCEGIEGVNLAVDAAKLLAMVRAVGSRARLKAVKGRKVAVSGGGTTFHLKAIPKKSEPAAPSPPKGGWSAISGEQVSAIEAIARLIDPKAEPMAFQALRIAPGWVAAARQDAMTFAWTEGIVDEAVSVEPHLFAGLGGQAELVADRGRVFVRSKDTGAVRWSLALALEWPEQSLMSALKHARDGGGVAAVIEPGDLKALCGQARVVAVDRAEPFVLQLKGGKLRLTGEQGVSAFRGAIEVNADEDSERWGARADRLETVAGIHEQTGGPVNAILRGPLHPLRIWGGEAVVYESIVMPQRLQD